MKKSLPNVTLLGVDCVDLARLQLAADICEKDFSFGAVKLLSSISSDDSRVIPIPAIRSTKAYSDFCVTQMAQYIDTDFVLIFQYDGFILNAAAWTDDFLNYDYIGAPWYHLGPVHVGNGGFSLRSKRLHEYIAKEYKTIGGTLDPEDFWICKTARPSLEAAGMSFAPEAVAARFSKEGDRRSVVWNGEFGFHGISYTDISAWLDTHPEYKDTLTYKLDDYAKLMKKYPVWNGTVHTLKYGKMHMSQYKKLASGDRDYDARADKDIDEDPIAPGHTMVFKRSGVPFAQAPVPAFERVVSSVEHFPTKSALLQKNPDVQLTYPTGEDVPLWRQYLISIFGNIFFPEKEAYTLFRFKR